MPQITYIVRTVRHLSVLRTLLIVVAGAVLLAAPAVANPDDDKARVDRELAAASEDLTTATAKAQQAATDYATSVAALPAAESAAAEAAGQVVAAEAAARRAQREVDAARAEQAKADAVLATASADVERARGGVAQFVTATYKGGGMALVDSLVTAGSPNEFAVRIGYLDKVAESRNDAVETLVRARGVASEQRGVAGQASHKAEEAAAAAARALERSRTAAAAAAAATERVKVLITQREAAVAVANQERGAVLAQYNKLQEESAQIAAELRAVAARKPAPAGPSAGGGGNLPAVSGGAFLTMPVKGRKTSNFGRRFHPLFHYWRLHTGMDLGAGMGAPIVAAADGEVVRAGYSGGSGNYTCVYHGRYQGDAISTCYAHQSQILVRPGQQVRRGQLIGRVGNTGNSTGPHLHFEVRLDGSPVDPAKWLPSCLC
jgi:murein DD-endopeptidase MepM/ murein hydrolase activator NlpD